MDKERITFISKTVTEFYASIDPERRNELNHILMQIQADPNSWQYSFELLTGDYDASNRHFGSSLLFTKISTSFDEIAYKANEIRQFLVNILTESHQTLSYAVVNKLSSCLAIFILSTMPDIWSNPFEELTVTWANNPEILMKVLSDVASLFPTIKVPLQQRNLVKNTLQTKSRAIIDITKTILCASDTTPSIQTAGIDCVENWMRLPGTCLEDWQSVFFIVLEGRINDNLTCSRIITIASENKEIKAYPKFCIAFIQFLVDKLIPNFCNNIQRINFNDFESGEDAEQALEDVCNLINSIVVFMTNIIDLLTSNENYHSETLPLVGQICEFFSLISNFPQPFPSKETFSDIPLEFWSTFRESLTSCETKDEVRQLFLKYYAQNLSYAIIKMSLPISKDLLTKQEYEKFETYRFHRAQDSINLYDLAPEETITFLMESLLQSYQEGNVLKSEAILYLFDNISDYFSETDRKNIEKFLIINIEFLNSGTLKNYDTYMEVKKNYSENLMNSITRFSYILFTDENESKNAIKNALNIGHYFMVSHPETSSSAVKYMLQLVERQSSDLLPMVENLIPLCYTFFQNESLSEEDRVDAMKIIGYLLSIKPLNVIIEDLKNIVVPRIDFLKRFSRGEEDMSRYHGNEFEKKVLFEIDVIAAIVKTVQKKSKSINSSESVINDMNGRTVVYSSKEDKREPSSVEVLAATSPVYMIMSEFANDILILLQKFYTNELLVSKLSGVLLSAIGALKEDIVHFGDIYINFIDIIIYVHTKTAADLIKNYIILTGKHERLYVPMIEKIVYWYGQVIDGKATFHNEEEGPTYMIELAYHIMRKGSTMLTSPNLQRQAGTFFRDVALIAIRILSTLNTNAKREASLTLKHWTKYIRDADDNGIIYEMIKVIIPQLLPQLLIEVRNRCISHNVLEAISDVLFTLVTRFPSVTTETYKQLYPEGNEGVMDQLFKNPGTSKSFSLKIGIVNRSARSTTHP
uniref:Xpo1 domain-containing protein n=1 Tax=Parastrongyloides trichosuri TaxID=131310 RepID=A0A0N4ZYE2_PARTI